MHVNVALRAQHAIWRERETKKKKERKNRYIYIHMWQRIWKTLETRWQHVLKSTKLMVRSNDGMFPSICWIRAYMHRPGLDWNPCNGNSSWQMLFFKRELFPLCVWIFLQVLLAALGFFVLFPSRAPSLAHRSGSTAGNGLEQSGGSSPGRN